MGSSKAGEDQAVVGDNQSKDESRPALPPHIGVATVSEAHQYAAAVAPGPVSTAEFYKHNSSIPARLMEALHPTLETMSNLYATLEVELAAKRTENKQLHEELKAARSRLADCEKNTASVYNENQVLHEKLQKTWQEHAQLDRKLSSRASSCLRAVQRVCSSRLDGEKLYVENQGIYAELQSARRYQMNLEKEVSSQQETIYHLRKKLEIAQRQVDQLEKAYTAKHERCQRLKLKLEAANFQKGELKQMLSMQPQLQNAASENNEHPSPSPQADAQANISNGQHSRSDNVTVQSNGSQQLESKHTAESLVIIASNQKTNPTAEPKTTLHSQATQAARSTPRSPEIQPVQEPESQKLKDNAKSMRTQSMPRLVDTEISRAHSQPRRSLTEPAVEKSDSSVQPTPSPRPTAPQADAPVKQSAPPGGGKAGNTAPPAVQRGLVTTVQPAMLTTRPPLPSTQRATSVPVMPRTQVQLPKFRAASDIRKTTDMARVKSETVMQSGSVPPARPVIVLPNTHESPFAAHMQQQAAAAMQKQPQVRQMPRTQESPFAAHMQQQAAVAVQKQPSAWHMVRAQSTPFTTQTQQQAAVETQKQTQTRPRARDDLPAAQMPQQAAVAPRQQQRPEQMPAAALKSVRLPSWHVPPQPQQARMGGRVDPMQAHIAASQQAQRAHSSKAVDAVARVRMEAPQSNGKK